MFKKVSKAQFRKQNSREEQDKEVQIRERGTQIRSWEQRERLL
jgi:hypothetical protein